MPALNAADRADAASEIALSEIPAAEPMSLPQERLRLRVSPTMSTPSWPTTPPRPTIGTTLEKLAVQYADPEPETAPRVALGRTKPSPFAEGFEPEVPEPDPEPVPAMRHRVEFPRYGGATVDRMSLEGCRPASQLAALVLPAFRAVNTRQGPVDTLKQLAWGAPEIPS